ncbi:hypothetical protein [Salinactinospora qingdaonensis]|uniref:Uncharacterized protein n=1 Tax=Salinactinospora qingdaonensis TaxID=702744 RepID=A0ABP7FDN1_9ACTN
MHRGFSFSAASLLTVSTLFIPAAVASAETSVQVSADEFHERVEAYQAENPKDYVGLEKLVESLGGEFSVSTSITGETSAEEAMAINSEFDGQEAPSGMATQSWPSDAFVVSVASSQHPSSPSASVSGYWNYRDDFVGQGSPYDIAALRFSDSCGQYSSYNAQTYNYQGTTTNRATLRSAGVGTSGPAWNIEDGVSGFVNYTDNGYVSVRYDLSECGGTVQAAFDYEGNNGGSVLSVSAGWGGLSVSYSNPGLTLQKSSTATTL